MRRRTLLAALSSLVAPAAGCLSETALGPGTTTHDRPRLTDTLFRMTKRSCGSGTNEATVSFDTTAGRVTVSGTIAARNLCEGARLAGAGYDPRADELTITVETHTIGDGCAECLADLAYRATAEFEGGVPGSVVVEHDSMGERRTVARVGP